MDILAVWGQQIPQSHTKKKTNTRELLWRKAQTAAASEWEETAEGEL